MSAGASLSWLRLLSRFSSVQHITLHCLSSKSRMVCTCGKIRRPLGACGSCGITSSIVSPGFARLPVKLLGSSSSVALARALRSLLIPIFRIALIATGLVPKVWFICSTTSSRLPMVSILLSTIIVGISSLRSSSDHCFSNVKSCDWSTTSNAMSA